MECSSRIYHKNDLGFTRQCSCQEGIHLNFGNISLLLSRMQLKEFAAYIAETIVIEEDMVDPDDRSIYLPTRDYCLMFAMTYHELQSLAEILDHTLLMMQVDDALSSSL